VFLSLNSENNLRRKHLKTIKRKIMKTKTRTLLAICLLGSIATINVNAANYKNANNNLVVEEVKNLRNGSNMKDEVFPSLSDKSNFSERDANFESVQLLLSDDLDATVDLQKEAQLVTKLIADQEEAKLNQKLIAEGRFGKLNVKDELQSEALEVTKLIADQEEAKLMQKLIDEGKLGVIN